MAAEPGCGGAGVVGRAGLRRLEVGGEGRGGVGGRPSSLRCPSTSFCCACALLRVLRQR